MDRVRLAASYLGEKVKLTRLVVNPEPKRKTLAERAGEPRSTTMPAPTSNSRPTIKGTSLVGAGVSLVFPQSSFISPTNSTPTT